MSNGTDRRDPDDRSHRERKPRGRKDTRRWCRGKEGVEHVGEVALPTWVHSKCHWIESHRWVIYADRRRWEPTGNRYWQCFHIERCTTCGKKLRHLGPEDCPVKPATVDA